MATKKRPGSNANRITVTDPRGHPVEIEVLPVHERLARRRARAAAEPEHPAADLDISATSHDAAPWWFPRARHHALRRMVELDTAAARGDDREPLSDAEMLEGYRALYAAGGMHFPRARLAQLLLLAADDPEVASAKPVRTLALLFASIAGDLAVKLEDLIAELDGPLQARRIAARHVKNREAREWVREQWQRDRDAYKGNKSDFARTMVRRLWTDRGIEAKDRTIREDWLRGL